MTSAYHVAIFFSCSHQYICDLQIWLTFSIKTTLLPKGTYLTNIGSIYMWIIQIFVNHTNIIFIYKHTSHPLQNAHEISIHKHYILSFSSLHTVYKLKISIIELNKSQGDNPRSFCSFGVNLTWLGIVSIFCVSELINTPKLVTLDE